jgi:hypothetical protein
MLFRLVRILPFAILAVAVLAGAALILYPHRVLGVGHETLAHSIQQEIGFAGGKSRCRERERDFACVVRDPAAGPDPRYLVRVRDDCWRARRPGQPMREARLRGCLGLDDYVRPPALSPSS